MGARTLDEPTFHGSSHGCRPGRSGQTAIAEAQQHVEAGYEWVVALDVENFFNRVHHQRLLARLAQRVRDRHVRMLISRRLKAQGVMPDGVVVSTEEGGPQGGPLSPVLSNLVLDELDWELARRGHRFVRYADDSNIDVRRERAGPRVMASITQCIEKRLRLKVNADKSAVAHPEERHVLGVRLRREPMEGPVEVLLSTRSKERLEEKIRVLLPRKWGGALTACIPQLNGYLLGWIGSFGICTAGVETTLTGLDAHIRRRWRAVQLAPWKRKRTIAKELIQLGIRHQRAWRSVYEGRKSLWAMSPMPTVDRALRHGYWTERGLVSLAERWRTMNQNIAAPVQLPLALG